MFEAAKAEWRLSYDHQPPGYSGGHFVIYVSDETRGTRFVGGR